MGIEFGRNARKIVERGDMACAFQYVNEDESAVFYPLLRTRNVQRSLKAGAYVIPIASTWKYQSDRYCMQQARIAAELMGFDPHSKKVCIKIASFFQDMIIELLTMKPMPMAMRRSADITGVRVDGNKITIEANA